MLLIFYSCWLHSSARSPHSNKMQTRPPKILSNATHTSSSSSENANTTSADMFSSPNLKWKNFLEKRQQRLLSGSGNLHADLYLPEIHRGKESRSNSSRSNSSSEFTHQGRKGYTDQRKLIHGYQYQLIMLWQATRCLKSSNMHFHHHDDDFSILKHLRAQSVAFTPQCCTEVQLLCKHISICQNGNECNVPHCVSSRYILGHHKSCTTDRTCPVCVPVRKIIKGIKRRERVERKILTGLPGEFYSQYCSQYGLLDRSKVNRESELKPFGGIGPDPLSLTTNDNKSGDVKVPTLK